MVGCGKIRSLVAPIDDMIAEALFARFDGPAFTAQQGQADDATDSANEVRDLEAKLAELAILWADGEIDRRSWAAARQHLEDMIAQEKRKAAGAAMGRARATLTAGISLRQAWPDLSIDQQRALLAATIERIDVAPAVKGRRTFDPDRFSIVWQA